ncbi:MAG: hypothetical protein EOP09_12425 [Proteobacteria bacterium]|nr:MAG: hypothetical protein EOP09_12425 [Pseudomonadota bacterium]
MSKYSRRTDFPQVKDYRDYRDLLRCDFFYRCGYCGYHEGYPYALEFHIDHFFPKSSYPELINEYGNLLWSCSLCNRSKHAGLPICGRLRLFDPCEVDFEDHFEFELGLCTGEPLPSSTEPESAQYTLRVLSWGRKPFRDRLLTALEKISQHNEILGIIEEVENALDQLRGRQSASIGRERDALDREFQSLQSGLIRLRVLSETYSAWGNPQRCSGYDRP